MSVRSGTGDQESYHYDPFGSIIETSGSIENRITYTGQMYDGISGQYYLRARFYNPKIGRFMQEDAYRGDGLNLYAYCQNNPITYYDPSGYMGLCPAGKSNTFEQEQYKNRINQTPSEYSSLGTWTGKRGESTFIPSDPKLREMLQTQYGVDGVT
ncbi:MAG: RHS repeat-associated core domain-containing protein [Lacrimispora sphenoides]